MRRKSVRPSSKLAQVLLAFAATTTAVMTIAPGAATAHPEEEHECLVSVELGLFEDDEECGLEFPTIFLDDEPALFGIWNHVDPIQSLLGFKGDHLGSFGLDGHYWAGATGDFGDTNTSLANFQFDDVPDGTVVIEASIPQPYPDPDDRTVPKLFGEVSMNAKVLYRVFHRQAGRSGWNYLGEAYLYQGLHSGWSDVSSYQLDTGGIGSDVLVQIANGRCSSTSCYAPTAADYHQTPDCMLAPAGGLVRNTYPVASRIEPCENMLEMVARFGKPGHTDHIGVDAMKLTVTSADRLEYDEETRRDIASAMWHCWHYISANLDTENPTIDALLDAVYNRLGRYGEAIEHTANILQLIRSNAPDYEKIAGLQSQCRLELHWEHYFERGQLPRP